MKYPSDGEFISVGLARFYAAREYLKTLDIPADSEQAVGQANFWADDEGVPKLGRPWNIR